MKSAPMRSASDEQPLALTTLQEMPDRREEERS